MGNSLRDELLKAGLVSEEQARNASRKARSGKARHDARGAKRSKPARGQSGKRAAEAESGPAPARSQHGLRENRRRAERIARDASLAASAGVPNAAKARRERVEKLLSEHALKADRQDIPYHFVRGKRIKRIYVSAEQRKQLLDGDIVVVAVEGSHYLLATTAAQQLLELAPNAFVASVSANLTPDDDEGEFPVPDDISW